jgi:hypothetical protein
MSALWAGRAEVMVTGVELEWVFNTTPSPSTVRRGVPGHP